MCALATTDTPVLNDHLERIAPSNRTHRTTDHAQGVPALPAGCSDEIAIKAEPLADQPAHAVVGVRTGAYTLITASATIEIEKQQALRLH